MTDSDKIHAVLDVIHQYAGFDGSHHKQWLIDQIVHILTGKGYGDWIKHWEEGEDGPKTYEWEIGTPP